MNTKNSNSKAKTGAKYDSFLEAIRDLGGDFGSTVNKNLKDGSKDIFENIFPFKKNQPPHDPSPLEETNIFSSEQENQFLRKKLRQFEGVKHQEVLLFSQEQRKTQQQVNVLQDEIKKLTQATGELARESQVAAFNNTPNAGVYHKNLFEAIIQTIRNIRSHVQESSFWLASWNKKAQKKNSYGNMAKKFGASFMLHHDRSVATQTG